MPIPQTPTSATVPLMRHRSYFIHEGDVTFKVENFIFRVHRYFFTRESAHFRSLLSSSTIPGQDAPGSSEADPVVLDDATSEAFACFLWVFYNPQYSIYKATADQWSSILHLAQKWAFKYVEELCIRELEKLDLSPVDRIHIYQLHGLDPTLLVDSFSTLTTRDEPIGLEEGGKLGLRISLQIARAREMSRGPDTGNGLRSPSPVKVQGPDLQSLILDIFGLPKIHTNGAAHPGPLTAPAKRSDKVDRASALPAVCTVEYFPLMDADYHHF
ncbi:hypothetical protein B0F90DRAFT_1629573 [Multifurca ochricompacta]|uniref:BTB domain-containing protein n=1 Tax=Multifurca ochricompacta TaxID=376703 RepID=A0AAD4M383_9AGAM|nr:hypothetical protein B0F90DRAFT_1629573 [Multifurca ochricompacta]